jgi:hypothetical protein
MTNISDVNVMDVKGKVEHRDTKYCVCISTGDNKDRYFLIDSKSRKMYDDFEIKKSVYDFLEHDSHISCSKVYELEEERYIEKIGNVNYEDMQTILNKVRNSDRITRAEKDVIVPELENWLKDDNYAGNKLSAVFKCR